jgi:signal transduction histidine kinase
MEIRFRQRSYNLGRFLLTRFAGYLIYAAVAARALLLLWDDPQFGMTIGLIGIYGLLLAASQALPARQRWLGMIYLLAQTGLTLAIICLNGRQNFLPLLFFPLSFQTPLYFEQRTSHLWMAAFGLLTSLLILVLDPSAGLLEIPLYLGGMYFVGRSATTNQLAMESEQRNREFIAELQATGRRLEAYAAQSEEYAIVHERSRVAREMHDSVTQTIFSMNLSAQSAEMLWGDNPARMADEINRLQTLARGAVREIQLLTQQLRAPEPWEQGLPAALRQLANERQARDGLDVQLTLEGERSLIPATAAGLYHIAQEALNNVVKHARTRQVAIRLDLDSPLACLEIRDQGQGFELAALRKESEQVGLRGMQERARELDWNLTVTSAPGRGTLIRVEEADES